MNKKQELIQKWITPIPYKKANEQEIDKWLADDDWIWFSDEELTQFEMTTTREDISLHEKATEQLHNKLDNWFLDTKDLLAIKEQSFKEIRAVTKNEDMEQELIPSTIQIQIINN